MSRIQPKDLCDDGDIFWIWRYHQKLAVGTQRSMAEFKKFHCVVITHVLNDMTAEDSAKPPRIAAQILDSSAMVNGKALLLAEVHRFLGMIDSHSFNAGSRKQLQEHAATATHV